VVVPQAYLWGVLAVVGLAGFGFWVYLRDQVDFDVRGWRSSGP